MWLVKNKIWAGDYKIFTNRPTRNSEGYWEDQTESNNDRRYGYIIPPQTVPVNVTWDNDPLEISISPKCNPKDDEPIYMIAKSEKGSRDCYGDFNYGYCPLKKYANDSNMVSSKLLERHPHGYGCAGYVVKTTMRYLKQMGWESDYEKYKTTKEVWDDKYKRW